MRAARSQGMAARALLVYDGECGLCRASVGWLRRRLRLPIALVPFQQLTPGELGLSPTDVRRSVWWIEGSRREAGHAAVARALMACGGGWGLLGRLLLVPPLSALARLGYYLIARYRHRLSRILSLATRRAACVGAPHPS